MRNRLRHSLFAPTPCLQTILVCLLLVCASAFLVGFTQEESAASTNGGRVYKPGDTLRKQATRMPAGMWGDAQTKVRAYKDTLDIRLPNDKTSERDAELVPRTSIAPRSKRYTILVYMIGSNLESANAAATTDLEEMLGAAVDYDALNVVVLAGGSNRWNSNIPCDCNSVLDLSREEGDRIVAQTQASVSMGSGSMLTSFLRFGREHYPAEHTALVFWDHGGGPLWGFGSDETFDGDGLLFEELRQALDASPFGNATNVRLDWVGFDSCLMGSLENANLWSAYTNWLVASEEVEQGDGWDYTFLRKACETEDAKQICLAAVDAFGSYYESRDNTLVNPEVTLAAYDLTKVGEVTKALDGLAARLQDDVRSGDYARVSRAHHDAKTLGLSSTEGRTAAYDLIDLGDFAQLCKEAHGDESQKLLGAIDQMVVARVTNAERICGVSLYFPGENRELYETFNTSEGEGGKNSQTTLRGMGKTVSGSYGDLLDSYAQAWLQASNVDWSTARVDDEDGKMVIRLDKAQREALSSATYAVMEEMDVGGYSVLTEGVEMPVDEAGVVRVPADPMIIATDTDLDDPAPCWFRQIDSSQNTTTFASKALCLSAGGSATSEADYNDDSKHIAVTLEVTQGGEASIVALTEDDGTVGTGGRNAVDVSDCVALLQLNYAVGSVMPSYDESGNILPWNQWESRDLYADILPVDKSFGFVVGNASNYFDACTMQVVLTDINGMPHALEPIQLDLRKVPGFQSHKGQEEVVDVASGSFEFTVFPDHAVLQTYRGTTYVDELIVPSEVAGVPVTTIGREAFSSDNSADEGIAKKIVVPEGVSTVEEKAFYFCKVQKVVLPTTLKRLSPNAFFSVADLQAFSLAGTSDVLSVQDGVLFSADKKTLLAYPNAKGSTYEIPAGTTALGNCCFAESEIEEVAIPEGVDAIGSAAFYDCEKLSNIKFPTSLTRIGSLAFSLDDWNVNYTTENRESAGSITIGPSVEYIGSDAFAYFPVAGITVDERNERYTSKDGCLLNAAGDVLIAVPCSSSQVIQVPEGVAALEAFAMRYYSTGYYSNDTNVILPSSLTRCEETSLPRGVSIHAQPGTYAERFALDREMPCDNVTDPALLQRETKTLRHDARDLKFYVYSDHAVLLSISSAKDKDGKEHYGEETSVLSIPGTAFDKPVTEIDLDVSTNGYGIKKVILPTSLQEVAVSGLSRLYDVESFEMAEGNPSLKVVDGVLFSADGRQLVVFPRAKEGTYQVPDGTRVIGKWAFDGANKLSAVQMPNSVRTIEEDAFMGCRKLEQVAFGKGLREIGERAFLSCSALRLDSPLPSSVSSVGSSAFKEIASYNGLVLPEYIEHVGGGAFACVEDYPERIAQIPDGPLRLGATVEGIDPLTFAGLGFSAFEVDKDNQTYVAQGPFLLTKNGRSVVAFASGYEGAVTIPQSVRVLELRTLRYAGSVTDLTIPASVTHISHNFRYDKQLLPATMRVHVERDSYAHRYAIEHDLPWIAE